MNQFKVLMLMTAMTLLLLLAGSALGRDGMIFALMLAFAMNFLGYWFSDRMVIAMTRARPLAERDAPGLWEMVRRLSREAGIPMPKLYLTPSSQPNAFATGRNPENAAVAVTDGLLKLLNREEVEGVLAHEIAHIRNRDILIASIVAVMAGAITMLASIARWGLLFGGFGGRDNDRNPVAAIGTLVMIILAPLAALIIQLAISRTREYQADATGAQLARSPDGLASALQKLERAARLTPMEVNPAAAHMFIVNPLSGRSMAELFSTHPPVAKRVERLMAMRR